MANTKIANLRGPTGAQGAQGNPGATGATGSQGPTGAGYTATATNVLVGLGSTTVTTQAGLAYSIGARIRISGHGTPTNFIEGLCTAYNSTTGSLTINSDLIGGSGTMASADINLAGQPGQTGATGPTGNQGPQGPTGATGATGENANTTTSAAFTIPAIGQTVTVTVADAGWIVVGQMLYVDQAGGGPGQAGALQVTAKTGNQLTLLNPQPPPAIPLASSSTAGLLTMVSGNTTDFVDGTNTCQNLVTAIQPTIWSARLRSFNAIGNPTFEVDQRNVGTSINTVPTAFICDRWTRGGATGTFAVNCASLAYLNFNGGLVAPGTNFKLSHRYFWCSLSTAQASLGAGDGLIFIQSVEGICLRELAMDVTSLQIVAQCSVVPLTFAITLRDNPVTRSFVHLCTITTANVWQLFTIPNIPVFPSGGNWTTAPGSVGYTVSVCVAAGSNFIAPATDSWQNGSFTAAAGLTNFVGLPTGTVFDIGFVQHEPGPVCTAPMDLSFADNFQSCKRYFQKSNPYPNKCPINGDFVNIGQLVNASTTIRLNYRFEVEMAKPPTINMYDIAGTANQVYVDGVGNLAISGSASSTNKGIVGIVLAATQSPGFVSVLGQFSADTSW